MPPPFETTVRRLRSLAGPPEAQSDRKLLARFRATRDDRAFATLVARHGPAVLGVCRRILHDPHAADDAFQAVFLVLARRAGSIRKAASLGCWLHGVAVRVSMKLKGRLARLPRTVESVEVPAAPRDDVLWRDVRRVLDEEVNRLPERLRLPVFLCYFEGKTRDEAAEALGWKLTTLRGRLEDGRLRLRTRLALRGVELSVALLAMSAANGLAVSESLLESTARTASGVASSAVQSLAKGVAMSGTTKLTVGTLLLALGLTTTLLVYPGEAGETPVPGPTPKAAELPEEKGPPPAPAKDPAWGGAVEGVRARLRVAKTKLRPGDLLTFELDLKNEGTKTWKLLPIPFHCEVQVDKTWYAYSGMFEYKTPEKELKPGGELVRFVTVTTDKSWTERINLNRWSDVWPGPPLQLSPGKHQVQVAFPVSETVKPVSNTVEIEVKADEWGDAIGGVRARLRLAKTTFKASEPFEFELDLKNTGEQTYEEGPIPQNCEVELDGSVYKYTGPINITTPVFRLTPGKEFIPFVTVTADRLWLHSGTVVTPFILAPGKHKVRVSYPLPGKVKPVSQKVEFEVPAETGPFDDVRLVAKKGEIPLLYVILTDPRTDLGALVGLVVKHAAAALAEADRRKFATGNVVFAIRRKAGDDRGYVTGFSREQLEEIKKAKPEDARRLVGRHAWSTGELAKP